MKKQKKRRRGRPPKHGGYSLLIRGKFPENRGYIRKYLIDVRENLIRDIAGKEENLTAGQAILVDRVISKLGIMRLIEEYVKENGVFEDGELSSCLGDRYIRFDSLISRQLALLGIDKRFSEGLLNPLEIAELIDKESERDQASEHTSGD